MQPNDTPASASLAFPALNLDFSIEALLARLHKPAKIPPSAPSPSPSVLAETVPGIRVPSWAEFEAFDRRSRTAGLPGYHPGLPIDWACPCCGRTRFELLRWGRNQQKAEQVHGKVGWTQKLCVHHDHGPESNFYFEMTGRPPRDRRFENIVVCGDCNSADGRTKGKLALPTWWSFSISEIQQFITATPHAGIDLNVDLAEELFYRQNRVDHPDAPGGIPNARLRDELMGRRLEEKMREGCIYEIGI